MGNKVTKVEPDRMMGIQISGKNNKPIVSAALYIVSLIVLTTRLSTKQSLFAPDNSPTPKRRRPDRSLALHGLKRIQTYRCLKLAHGGHIVCCVDGWMKDGYVGVIYRP